MTPNDIGSEILRDPETGIRIRFLREYDIQQQFCIRMDWEEHGLTLDDLAAPKPNPNAHLGAEEKA